MVRIDDRDYGKELEIHPDVLNVWYKKNLLHRGESTILDLFWP